MNGHAAEMGEYDSGVGPSDFHMRKRGPAYYQQRARGSSKNVEVDLLRTSGCMFATKLDVRARPTAQIRPMPAAINAKPRFSLVHIETVPPNI